MSLSPYLLKVGGSLRQLKLLLHAMYVLFSSSLDRMFQRKKPSGDVQSSLQRFSDMHRDATSRAKHFRQCMEVLSPQDKRQLVDDFNFEAFHLIDSLLLHQDLSVDAQVVLDAESALWTLEQVLCFAPEAVGKGWQRNAIECILKRALLPRNLLAVRKIAIRLFLIWYQSLAVYNGTNRVLDIVFQCCLPYFPLKNGQKSERILQEYCESPTVGFAPPLLSTTNNNGYGSGGFEPAAVRITPIIMNGGSVAAAGSTSPAINEQAGVREKAQTLQIYLDKFLEYCSRETMKIEWADELRRVDCGKFLLDRVIVLYVCEVFPDIESNGVDVFGGWEGDEEPAQILDTADPQVIARYWLIRWMINIASASFNEQPSSGLLLYRQVLLSSQKATNNLLTLMREAMQLPLACSNVIHKVLALIRHWLLQKEIPVFVESGLITLEAWNLLLIHIFTSFFNSPYLVSSGDRLPSAISLTHAILQMSRDLANPSVSVLPRQLSKTVWAELLKRLSQALTVCCSRSDAYGSATAGGFTRTLLSVCVFVRVIREVELDERMWDDVWLVFKAGIWTQMVEQWSKVVENVTRALILNLFAIDLSNLVDGEGSGSAGHTETSSTGSTGRKLTSRTDKSSENGSVGKGHYLMDGEEDANPDMYGERNSEKEMQGVVQSTGNTTCWLRTWMRLLCLMDPTQPSRSQATVQTFSRTIELLLRVGCANALIHWLSQRLLRLQISQQPHAIAPLCSVLTKAQPLALVRAHILYHLLNCLRSEAAPLVLEQIPQMGIEDLGVLSLPTLASLFKMVNQGELSSKAVRVAALLCLSHPQAEKILLGLLENPEVDLDVDCLVLPVNALSILVVERADAQLFDTLLKLICGQKNMAAKLLPILCSNLWFVGRLGMESRLANAMLEGLQRLGDARLLNDLKWQLCALKEDGSWIKPLVEKLDKDVFLEGLLVQLHSQFPLPGFSVDQWNSMLAGGDGLAHKDCSSSVFIGTEGALMSFDKTENNNFLWTRSTVGRHCYASGTGFQVQQEDEAPVNTWLKSLCSSVHQKSSVEHPQEEDHLSDKFKQLPRPTARSYSSTDVANHSPVSINLSSLDMSDLLQFIENSHREPEPLSQQKWEEEMQENAAQDTTAGTNSSWRQFATDFRLLERASKVPASFHRDLRHLDSTLCREVHKVAVIYVGKEQEDKHSILSNTSASALFNGFVGGLGWPVQIGSPQHQGYCGGLPAGQTAPYFASVNTELIFHVSTMLTGDATQRLKHLGNDEVHVVWSENPKCYRRELIATRFCDILIVLYPASANLVRVQIETQDSTLQFGPLFDGACVHIKQIASLTRETVLNASRAYRNNRLECDRPNKHRETVFAQTKEQLFHMPLTEAIVHLYAPVLNS